MSKQSSVERCLKETFKEFDREELEVLLTTYMRVLVTLNTQIPQLTALANITLSNLHASTEKHDAKAAAKIKDTIEKFQVIYSKVEDDFVNRN